MGRGRQGLLPQPNYFDYLVAADVSIDYIRHGYLVLRSQKISDRWIVYLCTDCISDVMINKNDNIHKKEVQQIRWSDEYWQYRVAANITEYQNNLPKCM